jgi:chemotaxis protein MotB
MRRKKPNRPRMNHERWLVSYADFITLLFAFFVVLYASAQVDQRKIGRLAAAIQEAFRDLGVFPSANRAVDTMQLPKLEALQAMEQLKHTPGTNDIRYEDSEREDLVALENELKQALAVEIAIHAVSLHREVEGLVISLREFGFFDSGSAAIRPAAIPALDRIASILALRSCRLRIEGHTDNVPIHTESMASNWELSTARATELVRLLIVRYRLSPERLSAAGYAQYHPISSNATAQGRAQNRRVDIVILSERVPAGSARSEFSAAIGQGSVQGHPAIQNSKDTSPRADEVH